MSFPAALGKAFPVEDKAHNNLSREERLAAKLRENLRRRKSQARDLASEKGESGGGALSKRGDGG